MKSNVMMQTAKSTAITRCLVLLLSLLASTASAQQQEAVRTAPEPAPQQPPANNWFRLSTPGVRALAGPGSFPEYGASPADACCPGNKNGHFIHRLIAWATYCPKYRVCVCTQCCASCHYKGVPPVYLFMLNPRCMCGTGMHQTICNACYRGSKDCGGGPAPGHCQSCAQGAPINHP